jgi:hypothetical protein
MNAKDGAYPPLRADAPLGREHSGEHREHVSKTLAINRESRVKLERVGLDLHAVNVEVQHRSGVCVDRVAIGTETEIAV